MMTIAFLIGALLLSVLALAFVVPALLKQKSEQSIDPEQANIEATRKQLALIEEDADSDLINSTQLESIRQETESTLLLELEQSAPTSLSKDKSKRFYLLSSLVICLFVPITALLVYLSVGQPEALSFSERQASAPSIEEAVQKLEKHLAEQPDDVEGWYVLARTYILTNQFTKAEQAMAKVYDLNEDSADVATHYADAVVMANNGTFPEKAKQLLAKALQLEPEHTQALWLSGMAALKDEDFSEAIELFERSKATTDNPENIAELDFLIASAQQQLSSERTVSNQNNDNTTQAATETATEFKAGAGLNVSVSLSESLRTQINGDEFVFIFAKAATGPPAPLAAVKKSVSELPIELTLDDTMAMIADLKLSSFEQVVVSARVSKSDNPIAQSGDFEGNSAVINAKQVSKVSVVINRVVQ